MNFYKKGFTLIELMIVVAIIGVLAGIALPAYQEFIRDAEDGACKAEAKELAVIRVVQFAMNAALDDGSDFLNSCAEQTVNAPVAPNVLPGFSLTNLNGGTITCNQRGSCSE